MFTFGFSSADQHSFAVGMVDVRGPYGMRARIAFGLLRYCAQLLDPRNAGARFVVTLADSPSTPNHPYEDCPHEPTL